MKREIPDGDGLQIGAFLTRFFGEGNDCSNEQWAPHINPFKEYARTQPALPIVLPRYQEILDDFTMYVIARTRSEVSRTGTLITAFAGPSYCTHGQSAPAALDLNDPIDAVVHEYFPGRAFVLQTTRNRDQRKLLRGALFQMLETASMQPPRTWRPSKPIGRLIAEFEAELASGGEAGSLRVLEELQARGGITPTNLAHLRIKRLDRLGLSDQLLASEDLPDVLLQRPPVPVYEAVLNAVQSAELEHPLSHGDLDAAFEALRTLGLALPARLDSAVGSQALTVLLVSALGRGDLDYAATLIHGAEARGLTSQIPSVVVEAVRTRLREQTAPAQPSPSTKLNPSANPSPVEAKMAAKVEGWLDLFKAVAEGDQAAQEVIAEAVWVAWPSVSHLDDELAGYLSTLSDSQWKECWKLTGPFLESSGYDHVAPQATREFINFALTGERLSGGDLNSLYALTESYLRAAPSAAEYRDLLDELRETSDLWVSVENAKIALDFADRLVIAACPDPSSRMNLALALLRPLSSRVSRLDPQIQSFARQLSEELELQLSWGVEGNKAEIGENISGKGEVVLLYSLDTNVLTRVASILRRDFTGIKVHISSDKVSTSSLKEKAQNATRIVIATRCAKHAATGAITSKASPKSAITYADGSGSASLLRAAYEALSSQ